MEDRMCEEAKMPFFQAVFFGQRLSVRPQAPVQENMPERRKAAPALHVSLREEEGYQSPQAKVVLRAAEVLLLGPGVEQPLMQM